MRVSKDVVFDEMSSWYAPMKMKEDVDERSYSVLQDVEQHSQDLSGLGESSNSGSNISPWTRRLQLGAPSHGSVESATHVPQKGKEKVDQHIYFDVM